MGHQDSNDWHTIGKLKVSHFTGGTEPKLLLVRVPRTIISALRPASPGEKCRTFLCMESPESVIRSENVLSGTKGDQELLKSTGEFLKEIYARQR
ncbi:hypothetical protein CEXT_732811 [Caerostris extrusa]|uniref:Uncharacterized protein n=1 Tax=Caerostris extrusa TaxID=172846 RepID=A0AAV4QZC1_CAEEX|nr:hypothetical protein CEXT_732811 [Caerostris extrusa]